MMHLKNLLLPENCWGLTQKFTCQYSFHLGFRNENLKLSDTSYYHSKSSQVTIIRCASSNQWAHKKKFRKSLTHSKQQFHFHTSTSSIPQMTIVSGSSSLLDWRISLKLSEEKSGHFDSWDGRLESVAKRFELHHQRDNWWVVKPP